jgi:hypothetical protein
MRRDRRVGRGPSIGLFGFALIGLVILTPAIAGSTTTLPPGGHEVLEDVQYRPTGSRVAFVWQAESRTDQGEWRLYRGDVLESMKLIDTAPARRGQTRYRYEARHPLDGREFFQLAYLADDGTETVLATVLLVGTEFSTAIPSLPDGPSPALFSTPPGWSPPGFLLESDLFTDVLPGRDRPEPAVPPPRTVG